MTKLYPSIPDPGFDVQSLANCALALKQSVQILTGDSVGAALTQGEFATSAYAIDGFIKTINGEVSIISQIQETQTGTLATLTTDVEASGTGLLARTSTLESAQTTADGAIATLQTEVEASSTGLLARTTTLESAQTTTAGAVATLQTEVEASSTGLLARVTTNETAIANIDGSLSATWSVTTSASGKAAGLKLQTVGGAGTTTTSFDVDADHFNVWASGQSNVAMFSVATVNGATQVCIDGVNIKDLTTNNNAINNNAVTNGSSSTGRGGAGNTSGTASLTSRAGSRIVIMATYNGGTVVTGASSFRAGQVDITYTPPGGSAVTKVFIIPNFWNSSTALIVNMTCTAIIQIAGAAAGTWSAFAHSYLPTVGDYTDVDTTIVIQEFSK